MVKQINDYVLLTQIVYLTLVDSYKHMIIPYKVICGRFVALYGIITGLSCAEYSLNAAITQKLKYRYQMRTIIIGISLIGVYLQYLIPVFETPSSLSYCNLCGGSWHVYCYPGNVYCNTGNVG